MTSIQLTLTGAQARAEVDGLLTAGMVGVPVTITWDESWNGLIKTLVCRSDGCIRTILDVGSRAMVAPEVFRTERWAPNALYLGVEGRDKDGKLVIPSTFAYCGQILPGAVAEGDASMKPENPAWMKLLNLIGNMDSLVTTQKENLVEAINEAVGKQHDQGSAVVSVTASYQLGGSGTEIPTGKWRDSVPQVTTGQYLWTKITITQEGTSASVYTVSGGASAESGGGVTSVNRIQPDSNGNVTLTAANLGALSVTGGVMSGALNMNGQSLSGLSQPTGDAQAANKGYVDTQVDAARSYTDTKLAEAKRYTDTKAEETKDSAGTQGGEAVPPNLLDNSDLKNPINQRGQESYTMSSWGGCTIDRWSTYVNGCTVTVSDDGIRLKGGIFQTIGKKAASRYNGKTVTIAAKIGGEVYIARGVVDLKGSYNVTATVVTPYGKMKLTCEASNTMFFILENTTAAAVEWAAVYEGEYTADTLPEYQPKGCGVELAECMRYYQRHALRIDTTPSFVPISVPMRVKPTVSFVSFSGAGEPSATVYYPYAVMVSCDSEFFYGAVELSADL